MVLNLCVDYFKHITCTFIYRSYVFIKIDDMEAQWSMKNSKISVSSIQKFWKLLARCFPSYAYDYSTSFNFSINGFEHVYSTTSDNSIFFLFPFACLEFMHYVVKCQNLLCSTPVRRSNLNS